MPGKYAHLTAESSSGNAQHTRRPPGAPEPVESEEHFRHAATECSQLRVAVAAAVPRRRSVRSGYSVSRVMVEVMTDIAVPVRDVAVVLTSTRRFHSRRARG